MSLITYKGGKKNTAKNALLQVFRPLVIEYKKDSGLRKLSTLDANPSLSLESVTMTGKALFCGFYLNEIICRLCPADAHFPELYDLYLASLQALAALNSQSAQFELHLQLILRQFEFRLLALLGYGLNLETEVEQGTPIEASYYYALHSDSGFMQVLPSPSSTRSSWSGELLLQLAELLAQPIGMKDETYDSVEQLKAMLSAAKLILRACLHRHLGDKPLKSRELFRKS